MPQEGLPFLLPHVTKQVLRLGAADFLRLLTEKNLPLVVPGEDTADAAANVPSKQAPLTTPAVLTQLAAMESGGAVALLQEEDARKLGLAATVDESAGALAVNAPLAISVWRTRASLSVLVAKNECEQLAEKVKGAQQKLGKQ